MRRLDLRLPTESPIQAFDGLNRRPVTGRVRVLAERTGGWTRERGSVQLEGKVVLREPPCGVLPARAPARCWATIRFGPRRPRAA